MLTQRSSSALARCREEIHEETDHLGRQIAAALFGVVAAPALAQNSEWRRPLPRP